MQDHDAANTAKPPTNAQLRAHCEALEASLGRPVNLRRGSIGYFLLGIATLCMGAYDMYRGNHSKGSFSLVFSLGCFFIAVLHRNYASRLSSLILLNNVLLNRLDDETAKAVQLANKRHKFNRERKKLARASYFSKSWVSTADAGRTLAKEFSVEPKVAEAWIRKWLVEQENPPAEDEDSPGVE